MLLSIYYTQTIDFLRILVNKRPISVIKKTFPEKKYLKHHSAGAVKTICLENLGQYPKKLVIFPHTI